MGMTTRAFIDIDASRERVWAWITEPDKLTAWLGGAGAMPSDTGQLKVGFTAQGAIKSPGGDRPTTMLVTGWDPPTTFASTTTYDGGDSLSTYTLTELPGGGTRLELSSDTDWAATDESGVDAAMAGQDDATKRLIADALKNMEGMLAKGAFDAGTQGLMQKSLEDSMQKLKQLIEKS